VWDSTEVPLEQGGLDEIIRVRRAGADSEDLVVPHVRPPEFAKEPTVVADDWPDGDLCPFYFKFGCSGPELRVGLAAKEIRQLAV
jgi:hypothetical protein